MDSFQKRGAVTFYFPDKNGANANRHKKNTALHRSTSSDFHLGPIDQTALAMTAVKQ